MYMANNTFLLKDSKGDTINNAITKDLKFRDPEINNNLAS